MGIFSLLDVAGIRAMISAQGKRQIFAIVKIWELPDKPSCYFISFHTGVNSGAEFRLATQMRKDRAEKIREFRSIDTAIRVIKETGYTGNLLMRIDAPEGLLRYF